MERTVGYLESSFLPLPRFSSLEDLQAQSDAWAAKVAYRRHHRRAGAVGGDALAVERHHLRALPEILPDTDRRTEVRVKAARFPQVKTLDDFDFGFPRSVRRQVISHLAQLDFLR